MLTLIVDALLVWGTFKLWSNNQNNVYLQIVKGSILITVNNVVRFIDNRDKIKFNA